MLSEVAAVIFENDNGEILLYLRDNKPTIPFPHHWDLFGGHVEAGESPEEALVREVKEELDYDLKDYQFFKRYDCLDGDVKPNVKFVYTARMEKSADELVLHEGERLAFIRKEDIPTLNCANIIGTILTDYIESKNNE